MQILKILIVITDPVNAASLKDMQDALFIICLDQPRPNIGSTGLTDFVESTNTLVANRCLHGNGTPFNTCNRWFDSTSQVRGVSVFVAAQVFMQNR